MASEIGMICADSDSSTTGSEEALQCFAKEEFLMKIAVKLFLLVILVALCATPMMITAPPASASTPTVASDDEDQPHMQAALDALKQAEQHLNEAKHDKGGHRVAALKATRDAIKHVEEGMRVADKH
jgi:hypothetical protein